MVGVLEAVCMFHKVFTSFSLLTRKNLFKREGKKTKKQKQTSIDTLDIEMTCITR